MWQARDLRFSISKVRRSEKFGKDCIVGDKNDAKVSQMTWGCFIGGYTGRLNLDLR